MGVDSSTKLSPFVALGCITPRAIDEEVRGVWCGVVWCAAPCCAVLCRAMPRNAVLCRAALCGSVLCLCCTLAAPQVQAVRAAALAVDQGGAGDSAAAGGVAARVPVQCDWLTMHLAIR